MMPVYAYGETATQVLDRACPEASKNLDEVIQANTLTPNWSSASDKADFIDYLRHYIIQETKEYSPHHPLYADDWLTVASECILRKNKVIDDYFNKNIDETMWVDRNRRLRILMMILNGE